MQSILAIGGHNGPEHLRNFRQLCGGIAPTEELLRAVYIQYYQNHRLSFADGLQQTHAKWIAMDHTFKVSVNIGVERKDGVWVRLYDSLFVVVNELGLVMEYRLVKGRVWKCGGSDEPH